MDPYMVIKILHTLTPCQASSVCILLMTSQSIADDVKMQSHDLAIVIRAHEKWLLISNSLYPPYPKDRGMLWFYVEAARRPQWC